MEIYALVLKSYLISTIITLVQIVYAELLTMDQKTSSTARQAMNMTIIYVNVNPLQNVSLFVKIY